MAHNSGGTHAWVIPVVVALIGAIATIAASVIGRQSGVEVGQRQAFATSGQERSTDIAQSPFFTQIVITQVAITQVVITQISVPQTDSVNTQPSPTITPVLPSITPIPTPDPRLFWDDFENGIKPEWRMSGNGFKAKEGRLIVDFSGSLESGIIGDSNWRNYKIRFYKYNNRGNSGIMQFRLRVQDRDNYILLKCSVYNSFCNWYTVSNGQEREIPGAGFRFFVSDGYGNEMIIEIENNVYRVFEDGNSVSRFTNDAFSHGGFELLLHDPLMLSNFEVFGL